MTLYLLIKNHFVPMIIIVASNHNHGKCIVSGRGESISCTYDWGTSRMRKDAEILLYVNGNDRLGEHWPHDAATVVVPNFLFFTTDGSFIIGNSTWYIKSVHRINNSKNGVMQIILETPPQPRHQKRFMQNDVTNCQCRITYFYVETRQ